MRGSRHYRIVFINQVYSKGNAARGRKERQVSGFCSRWKVCEISVPRASIDCCDAPKKQGAVDAVVTPIRRFGGHESAEVKDHLVVLLSLVSIYLDIWELWSNSAFPCLPVCSTVNLPLILVC